METGFVKADSTNVPKIDIFMLGEFWATNSKFASPEFRNVKTAMMSEESRDFTKPLGYAETPGATNIARVFSRMQIGGHRGGIPTEFRVVAEDKLVQKEVLEEMTCSLPGSPRSTFLMVFSPDGKTVASTHGNHNVYVTDLATGKNIQTLSGHPRTPWCVAFHPSSNQILASGCLGGQVRVWDLSGGSEVWTAESQTVIASLAFHPTGRMLVIATYNEVHFWDWSQPRPFAKCTTKTEREKVRYVAFDRLGSKLITGIANPFHIASQWDRVGTGAPPVPPSGNPTPASTATPPNRTSGRSERERSIAFCYRNLLSQYNQLVRRYFDLSRSRTTPTIDRGTDPMENGQGPSGVGPFRRLAPNLVGMRTERVYLSSSRPPTSPPPPPLSPLPPPPLSPNPPLLEPASLDRAASNPPLLEPASLEPAVPNQPLLEPASLERAAPNPPFLEPASLERAAPNPPFLEPASLDRAASNPPLLEPASLERAASNLPFLEPLSLRRAAPNPPLLEPPRLERAAPNPPILERIAVEDIDSDSTSSGSGSEASSTDRSRDETAEINMHRLHLVQNLANSLVPDFLYWNSRLGINSPVLSAASGTPSVIWSPGSGPGRRTALNEERTATPNRFETVQRRDVPSSSSEDTELDSAARSDGPRVVVSRAGTDHPRPVPTFQSEQRQLPGLRMEMLNPNLARRGRRPNGHFVLSRHSNSPFQPRTPPNIHVRDIPPRPPSVREPSASLPPLPPRIPSLLEMLDDAQAILEANSSDTTTNFSQMAREPTTSDPEPDFVWDAESETLRFRPRTPEAGDPNTPSPQPRTVPASRDMLARFIDGPFASVVHRNIENLQRLVRARMELMRIRNIRDSRRILPNGTQPTSSAGNTGEESYLTELRLQIGQLRRLVSELPDGPNSSRSSDVSQLLQSTSLDDTPSSTPRARGPPVTSRPLKATMTKFINALVQDIVKHMENTRPRAGPSTGSDAANEFDPFMLDQLRTLVQRVATRRLESNSLTDCMDQSLHTPPEGDDTSQVLMPVTRQYSNPNHRPMPRIFEEDDTSSVSTPEIFEEDNTSRVSTPRTPEEDETSQVLMPVIRQYSNPNRRSTPRTPEGDDTSRVSMPVLRQYSNPNRRSMPRVPEGNDTSRVSMPVIRQCFNLHRRSIPERHNPSRRSWRLDWRKVKKRTPQVDMEIQQRLEAAKLAATQRLAARVTPSTSGSLEQSSSNDSGVSSAVEGSSESSTAADASTSSNEVRVCPASSTDLMCTSCGLRKAGSALKRKAPNPQRIEPDKVPRRSSPPDPSANPSVNTTQVPESTVNPPNPQRNEPDKVPPRSSPPDPSASSSTQMLRLMVNRLKNIVRVQRDLQNGGVFRMTTEELAIINEIRLEIARLSLPVRIRMTGPMLTSLRQNVTRLRAYQLFDNLLQRIATLFDGSGIIDTEITRIHGLLRLALELTDLLREQLQIACSNRQAASTASTASTEESNSTTANAEVQAGPSNEGVSGTPTASTSTGTATSRLSENYGLRPCAVIIPRCQGNQGPSHHFSLPHNRMPHPQVGQSRSPSILDSLRNNSSSDELPTFYQWPAPGDSQELNNGNNSPGTVT